MPGRPGVTRRHGDGQQVAGALDRWANRIPRAAALDRPAGLGVAAAGKVIAPGATRDLVSGTALGHPLHPVLVAVPIGSWAAASLPDLTAGDARAAQRLAGGVVPPPVSRV